MHVIPARSLPRPIPFQEVGEKGPAVAVEEEEGLWEADIFHQVCPVFLPPLFFDSPGLFAFSVWLG